MENQFSTHCKSDIHLKFLQESFEKGHGIWRNLCKPNPTALEVVQQYQHARDIGSLLSSLLHKIRMDEEKFLGRII